jgi:hypothetical protein
MPRIAKELGALIVSRITTPGQHAVGKVPSLLLQANANGARSWILRVTIADKRRESGLGTYPGVPLKDAHERALAVRQNVQDGIDPVLARKRFTDAKECEWRNTLSTYAYPLIGTLMIRRINRTHVTEILEPIWKDKTETASRLRGRIEAVLDWALVKGFREPAVSSAWRYRSANWPR